ncbi:2Fe-2S iron-sulfur cluster-binding protein [Sphingomonas sp.]|uniref:2Fe-2S iron-sulfur cluster-binding protein n=1 Tax=Sphingomonas sp. TaxID=28214 RepID=UPI003B3B73B7
MTLAAFEMSRRHVLAATAAAPVRAGAAASPDAAKVSDSTPSERVSLTVNGKVYQSTIDPRTTLLDLLRDHLRLTGTKKGCDHGQCGACTVLSDGHRINSCLTLAVMQSGREITTIEGIGSAEKLHPLQQAFLDHDGYQCGYCTPGQICSTVGALDEVRRGVPSHVTTDITAPMKPTDVEMRERLSGNICRCGAYANIHKAIAQVVETQS